MPRGGYIGYDATAVVTPGDPEQPVTITSFTSPNPAFAVQPRTTELYYLVVAGGGAGGGGSPQSGGGGAGGLRTNFPGGSTFPVSPGSTYPFTIGGGGSGSASTAIGASGSNSIFSSITSTGGGGAG
jgi:hypothetical protein